MSKVKERVAKNISLINFLTGHSDIACNKLEVANFQRNYIWKRKNIISLLDSINTSDGSGLYLGNIVVQRSAKGNSGGDLVVDGQQRLITLTLIAKALQGKVQDKTRIDKIIFHDLGRPRIKLTRTKLNSTFKALLTNENDIKKEDLNESQKTFIKNYELIKKRVREIDNKDLFFEKIKGLEVVVIKCPSTHDVNQLFESLNSRGEKLSPIQLSKNILLSHINPSESALNKINNDWEKMESSFEERGSKIIWFDKFFRHRWFYIKGYESNDKLFDAVKVYIKKIGAPDFSKNLLEDSRIYLSLRRGELGRKSNFSNKISDPDWRKLTLVFGFITKMNIDQVYSVFLALIKYGKKDENYFKKFFFRDMENIWKFFTLVRYSKKFNPNTYEKIFAYFCRDIHNLQEGQSFEGVRDSFFNEIFKLIPEENEFVDKLISKINCFDSKNVSKVKFDEDRDVIRSFLLIYLTDGERIESSSTETIEHIIPKGDISKWTNIRKGEREYVKKTLRYKLGNITILEKKLNSSNEVGNQVFDKKYSEGYKKSSFSKNVRLDVDYGKKFKSAKVIDAVNKRGKDMAAVIYKWLTIRK